MYDKNKPQQHPSWVIFHIIVPFSSRLHKFNNVVKFDKKNKQKATQKRNIPAWYLRSNYFTNFLSGSPPAYPLLDHMPVIFQIQNLATFFMIFHGFVCNCPELWIIYVTSFGYKPYFDCPNWGLPHYGCRRSPLPYLFFLDRMCPIISKASKTELLNYRRVISNVHKPMRGDFSDVQIGRRAFKCWRSSIKEKQHSIPSVCPVNSKIKCLFWGCKRIMYISVSLQHSFLCLRYQDKNNSNWTGAENLAPLGFDPRTV